MIALSWCKQNSDCRQHNCISPASTYILSPAFIGLQNYRANDVNCCKIVHYSKIIQHNYYVAKEAIDVL